MNSSLSEPRAETLPVDRPTAPAPLRYPQPSVRSPLPAEEAGPRPGCHVRRTSLVMSRHRRRKQIARRLLVWVAFWYVLGQLAMFAWIDEKWPLERTRVEREKWKQLHERLAEAPDRPLVLMLGSSRADWAFQAGRLNGLPAPDGRPLLAYNLAVPTTGPMHEALYLNDLLAEGIRPRLLLVEFVYTHLNKSQRGLLSEEHFTMPQWLSGHQALFLRPYYSQKRRLLIHWLESRLAPWYGFRCDMHEYLKGRRALKPLDPQAQPTDAWGWRRLSDDPGGPELRAWRRMGAVTMYGESMRRFRLGAGPVRAMRDTLARCRREQIPVALVRLPVTKEFYELIPAEGRKELDNLFAELSNGVHVIDASGWLPNEDFHDGHHVLKSGADKFTTRMIKEVHQLLVRTEPASNERPR
jgi:hypothetical protein